MQQARDHLVLKTDSLIDMAGILQDASAETSSVFRFSGLKTMDDVEVGASAPWSGQLGGVLHCVKMKPLIPPRAEISFCFCCRWKFLADNTTVGRLFTLPSSAFEDSFSVKVEAPLASSIEPFVSPWTIRNVHRHVFLT